MARGYAKISTSIWRSRKFRELRNNDRAKMLYFYFHSCAQVNSAGCFSIPIGYIEADLGWHRKAIVEAIESLLVVYLVEWNKVEEIVRIVGYLDHDPPTNPLHGKAIANLSIALPDCEEKLYAIRDLLANKHCIENKELRTEHDRLSKAYGKPIETPIPLPNTQYPIPNEEKSTCAEPSALALVVDNSVLISLPTNRPGESFSVCQSHFDTYQPLYPAVDVGQELRAMAAWLISNPKNAKTKNGMPRFINSWLSKTQNRTNQNGHGKPSKNDNWLAGAADLAREIRSGSNRE